MPTMIKGVTQAGPCLACGASGKYDPELYNDPDDFVDCESCEGTGYNQSNHVVIERQIGDTKLGNIISILNELYEEYIGMLQDEIGIPHDSTNLYELNEDNLKTKSGILTAVLFVVGGIDKTAYAKNNIHKAWDEVLESYGWHYDMKFKKFADVRKGGAGWHIYDEKE
jgi:hypothetical protein